MSFLFWITLVFNAYCLRHVFHATAGRPEGPGQAPAAPSRDPFYSLPANLSAYSPGDILRRRPSPRPLNLLGPVYETAATWQLLYRTTGAAGEPLATVTTVMVPRNAKVDVLLSYQVEIDTPCAACFTSVVLQQGGANLGNFNAHYSQLWTVAALARGWVVSMPDHEGPDGAFGDGIVGGQATLDGIKAVLRSGSTTGISPQAKVVVWGFSGGSQATEFALELQEDYAPDLNITAAAIGGLLVNVSNALVGLNKGLGSGMALGGLLGLGRAQPELGAFLRSRLRPSTASEFLQAGKQFLVATVVKFAFKDIYSYFDGGIGILREPVLAEAVRRNSMGQLRVPRVPMYVYHARHDELLPVGDARELVRKYCDAGANIEFVEEAWGWHVLSAFTGAGGAFRFLVERLEDEAPPRRGCRSRRVFTSAASVKSMRLLAEIGCAGLRGAWTYGVGAAFGSTLQD